MLHACPNDLKLPLEPAPADFGQSNLPDERPADSKRFGG